MVRSQEGQGKYEHAFLLYLLLYLSPAVGRQGSAQQHTSHTPHTQHAVHTARFAMAVYAHVDGLCARACSRT